MIENYDDFEAMFDRALEIATIKAGIWRRYYANDLTQIRHDGEYITAIGTDYCGDHVDEDFPTRYMNMTDNDIYAEIEGNYQKWQAKECEKDAKNIARETERQRAIYEQLKVKFKGE